VQTANLSLEEINAIFGDTVIVNLTNATDQEKKELDEALEEKGGELVHSEHVPKV
jgi:DNA polymerase III delta subunit